jgi:hypothetical protein
MSLFLAASLRNEHARVYAQGVGAECIVVYTLLGTSVLKVRSPVGYLGVRERRTNLCARCCAAALFAWKLMTTKHCLRWFGSTL